MQTVACPNCGEENPAKFRLCGYCGTPLAQALPPSELRKTVTILFSDLKGSTALGERIDPEALHEIKNRYFEAMSAVLERHGGRIEKYIGDAIMAVFGLPRVREDDALRAVRAAAAMQAALHDLNVGLELGYGVRLEARMGVNTGEVVATADPTADQRLADGDAVNVAARLEQAAPPMEVLIGDVTYQLVRDRVEVEAVEPLELKGKAERVPAFRLLRILDAADAAEGEAPLVGREAELIRLEAGFRAAVEARAGRLVTVVGDPGVGKSRLIRDVAKARAREADVLRGRCLPYGDGITFWPIVEIVREAAGIEADDTPDIARSRIAARIEGAAEADQVVERVAVAIGLTTTQLPVSELFWGIRKFLEALAARRPLVLVVDDIHSAEPTFLELLGHLVDSISGAAVFILCSARPDLLASQPDWAERPGMERIVLAPLSAEDAGRLIEAILGDAGLDPGLVEQVIDAAEGNPLFVEQLVSMLIDRGHVELRDGRWVAVAGLGRIHVPPTIQALLAARLDDLSREERAVVEPAAVIGLVFPRPAVEELVPEAIRNDVAGHLLVLDRKQLVQRTGDDDAEDEAYRFHHILIRDATYHSLLKRARAVTHERFVAWAERVNKLRNRETEFEEILGYHLEQAYRYRLELGPIDAEGREVANRAAAKLGSAGRRAFARGDMPAAGRLLRRAVDLLPEEDPGRLELVAELGEALMEQGDFDAAIAVLDAGLAVARDLPDARLDARIELARLAVDLFAGEASDAAANAVAQTERAIGVLERAGDQAGLARAWRLLYVVHGTAGRLAAAAEAAERATEHAGRVSDTRLAARGASGYALAALHGARPVADVLARCEALLEQVRGDRKAEAVILGVLAQLHAMAGAFERARDLYRSAESMMADLGPSVTAAAMSTESSRVEFLAGDVAEAARVLRRDHAALEALGERYFRSTVAALLAQALVGLGEDAEADRFATVAAELADDDDYESQVIWRLARARLLARAAEPDAAATVAEAGVAIARATEDVAMLADALVGHADVLDAIGQAADAAGPLREALELYERKGVSVAADRIRARLGPAGEPSPAGGRDA